MLYPILFRPIYKEMLWGGTRMHTLYGRALPYAKTGEGWDVSCRPNEMSVIENGADAGLTLAEYIARDPRAVLGERVAAKGASFPLFFPLLVKIIDAQDDLSVQVHPSDAHAQSLGLTDTGKNEAWYIMQAPQNGHIVLGLRPGVTRDALLKAHENEAIEKCLHYLPVQAGDMVEIPAGLVHALTKGVMVAEVQQSSDITFRLYDYNRVGLDGRPRELHLHKALDVIDFSGRIPQKTVQRVANPYFCVDKYILTKPLRATSDPAAFCVFTCVEGACCIKTAHTQVDVPASRSALIPAGLGEFEILPYMDVYERCVLLKTAPSAL